MEVRRVVFEEVFDVARFTAEFSFASGGRNTYAVVLPGRAIPQSGQSWLVAFDKPGDWTRVVGIHDPHSGRTEINARPAWAEIPFAEALIYGVGFSLFGALASTNPWLIAAAASAAAGLIYWGMVRPHLAIRRRLLAA